MRNSIIAVLMLVVFSFLPACKTVSNFSLANFYRSDAAIRESIQTSIAASDLFTDLKPIQVEAHQGQVILSGYVKTIRQSDVAGDIATKTAGVRAVENNLIVRK